MINVGMDESPCLVRFAQYFHTIVYQRKRIFKNMKIPGGKMSIYSPDRNLVNTLFVQSIPYSGLIKLEPC